MAGAPNRIYLDHNASAPLRPEAREALIDALESANPSSVHAEGRQARAIVEDARRAVADLAGCNPGEVTFTSGASEAATMALSPKWIAGGSDRTNAALAVLETDHAAFVDGGRFGAAHTTHLRVDRDGVLDMDSLDGWIRGLGGRPGLLALGLANAETGVLQDIARIGEEIAAHDIVLVADATQVFGRVPCRMTDLPVDAMIVSSHKIGGPKGVGALIAKTTDTRPHPLVRGGGQEKGRRAGTESVPGIAGFGAAARACAYELRNEIGAVQALRDAMEATICERSAQTIVLGRTVRRLPNTSCLWSPGLRAETAQMALDLAGFAVSAGSACSSGKIGRSHVLDAHARAGLAIMPEQGAIRVSFGRDTKEDDLTRFAEAYLRQANRGSARSAVGQAA